MSPEVLARYAADAATEIDGVRGLVASQLHRHRGIRIGADAGETVIEVHLDVDWGAPIPEVGRAVQERIRDYLSRMAGAEPGAVNIVVDSVGPTR